MKRGAGENEDFAADIIAAAEDTVASFNDSEKDQVLALLSEAIKVIALIYEDSLLLTKSFSQIDAQLNECEYEVSLASARLKGDPKEYFERLEKEKKREDDELRRDEERRSAAVQEHQKEAEGVIKGLVERAKEGANERDARERKEKALEEARRRNGEL
jgi:5'-3' exonuclease